MSIKGNYDKQIDRRRIVCIIIFTALAILLNFLRFRPTLVSGMFAIDFSILPELITSIAFGPIAGVIVCFVKFFIHITFSSSSVIPDFASFITDSVFIAFAEIFYSSHMYMAQDEEMNYKKFEREKTILFGGLLATIPTLILQFLLTEFFVFPKLEKYYAKSGITYEAILSNYAVSTEAIRNRFPGFIANHTPEIKAIWQGILAINLPITFVKLVLVTVVTMSIYRFISPFLHYRMSQE